MANPLAFLLYLTIASFSHHLLSTNAKTVTRYIDDTSGDSVTGLKPEYYPLDGNVWQDQTCRLVGGCKIVPDPQLAHNRTYHAATYRPDKMSNMGFILRFNGTNWNQRWIHIQIFPVWLVAVGLLGESLLGTGVAVYFILSPGADILNDSEVITNTECEFKMDGVSMKNYTYNPLPQHEMEYNVEAYKVEGLDNRLHVLQVQTGKKERQVFMAFDYATYT